MRQGIEPQQLGTAPPEIDGCAFPLLELRPSATETFLVHGDTALNEVAFPGARESEQERRRAPSEAPSAHSDRGWSIATGLICAVLLLAIFWRTYQGQFAWSRGLDASSPGFDRYWIRLLVAQLAILAIGSLSWWAWLLRRPCATCRHHIQTVGRIEPQHEEMHIKILWGIVGAWCLAFFLMAGFFGQQDAAWHQVAIRDTAFTPSHIVLFYGAFPLLVVFSIGGCSTPVRGWRPSTGVGRCRCRSRW